MSDVKSFPTSAKLMHWLSAVLIISMLFLGVSMIQSLATWHNSAIKLHQSFGVLVLLLMLHRTEVTGQGWCLNKQTID